MSGATLPVWPTVTYAFCSVWRSKGRFVALLILPLICMVALDFIRPIPFSALLGQLPLQSAFMRWSLSFSIGLPVALLSMVIVALFAVSWFRHVQGTAKTSWLDAFFHWSPVHTKVWAGVFAVEVVGVVVAIGYALSGLATLRFFDIFVPLIVWLILLARFSLVFPAVTAGAEFSPAASWRWTRGSGLQIIAAGLTVTIPFAILVAVLRFGLPVVLADLQAGQTLAATLVYAFLFRLIYFAGLAALGAALCRAYEVLAGGAQRPSAPLPGAA